MLSNDQLYTLSCIRDSLIGKGISEEVLIENEQYMIDIITRNGILLTVYNRLTPSIKDTLKTKYNMTIKQSITQDYEGKRIIQRIREEGIACIGLKGWELRSLYPEFTMRQMTDIDLLCSPYDFPKIKRIMTELGFNS